MPRIKPRLARGRGIVFKPEEWNLPACAYRVGAQKTESLLGAGPLDPDDPGQARAYFQRWLSALGDHGVDREGIQEFRRHLDYPEVARRFRMIDDTESVVTKYGEHEERREVRRLLDDLRAKRGDGRRVMRRLQPYVVAVRRRQAERYLRQGLIGDAILNEVNEWLGDYDPVRGLTGTGLDAEALVV